MPSVFLYGPDSLQSRTVDRIGKISSAGGAVLDGWALEFNKPNMKRNDEGLPNIVSSAGRSVFGVVYDLTPKQLETLDGYFGGYGRKDVEVKLIGSEGEKRKVAVWIARRTKSGLRPSKSTLDLTQRGAKENGAPETFRQELLNIEALND